MEHWPASFFSPALQPISSHEEMIVRRRTRLCGHAELIDTMVQLESERELRIRSWVDNTLSVENDLVPGAFPLTEQIIVKQGNLCGRLFCLHGPRSVRLVAVHDFSTDRILTYDSLGNRTGERAVAEVLEQNVASVQ